MTHCSSQVGAVYCDVYMMYYKYSILYTYTRECICIYHTCVYYTICIGMGVRVLLHRGDDAPSTASHFGVVHPEVCLIGLFIDVFVYYIG